uniref:NADH:ubiquinone reductase (H(+)-translocating) n=1 Tax=Setaphyes kielensis TaxID=3298910 RepID=A0A1I9VTT9_9BILA|nr:NADH dehydrogenase subunit 5 [Pycnophyes kielensis]APA17412.1 NADH dehydrogenase subunit 5 [Pycnophyes kielensis]
MILMWSGLLLYMLVMLIMFYLMMFEVMSIFGMKVINLGVSMLSSMSWGNLVIMFDNLSIMYMLIVSLITFFIFMYSNTYMSHYMKKNSFFWMMMFFFLSMMIVVVSGSWVVLFWGWDLLGVSSFLLVIYYDDSDSGGAGYVTIVMNRLGDAGLICLIGWLAANMLSFLGVQEVGTGYFYMWMSLLLMLICMTKSAQFPFIVWLPAAMAAPTPVSSLVHSSTLVTAGVYLMLRIGASLISMNFLSNMIMVISLLTIFMASMMAMAEADGKKIIALSTMSQLGFMFFCLSLGFYYLAFLHMMTHALFKASLFLLVGILLLKNFGLQDMRYISKWSMSMCLFLMQLNMMSMIGVPFFSGFISKDLILESMFMSDMGFMGVVFLLVGVLGTLLYSIKMFMSISVWGSSIMLVGSVSGLGFWEVMAASILSITSVLWVIIMLGVLKVEMMESGFFFNKLIGLTVVVVGVFFYLKMLIEDWWLSIMQSKMWSWDIMSVKIPSAGISEMSLYYMKGDMMWLENFFGYLSFMLMNLMMLMNEIYRRLGMGILFFILFLILLMLVMIFIISI